MNVIISNQAKDALSSLNIDVIKKLDGEYSVDEIISTFSNFYFNRMILDITAIKDRFNVSNLQKLSASFDASKIILFLDDDPRITNTFLSKIISLGIYNFTRDISGITYLMENPNSYRDVAQYHDLANEDEEKLSSAKPEKQQNNNTFIASTDTSDSGESGFVNTRIIGFKDLTVDAGSTTLVYMLKKQLKGKKVLAVELNSNDFSYFNDGELMSVTIDQFDNVKNKFKQFDYVFIDINNSGIENKDICDEVIYLLEPSTIKLNTLMRRDRQALEKIKNKKIVLNKSLLTTSDVKEFEYEAKVSMFYNIPPLDERKDHQMVLDSFLAKLGIISSSGETSNKLFDIFKK